MAFPNTRMRRLRNNDTVRALIRETRLSLDNLIQPLFVCTGSGVKDPVNSMPGVFRMSTDKIVEECKRIADTGIKAILLFGIPDTKDSHGASGYDENGIVQRTIREIKKQAESLFVITDVCNCEYTDHGHCGPVIDGQVHNDLTLEILGKQALSHAKAGADMVAPSDMMDGRIGYIRRLLDEKGFSDLPIMSYAVKYASSFYGPFREAACSAPAHGDRRSYQMDYCNSQEAIREAALDIDEGADIIMVKPALSYLDIVHRIKEQFGIPVAAYNVSGEYSMVKAAAEKGWIDEEKMMMEILHSIKRAGADMIISYYACNAATLIKKGWH